MSAIPVTAPFRAELYGEAHAPYGEDHAPFRKLTLELCALLFGGDTPAPFAFTSTDKREHSEVRGVVTHERDGEYASISIDVTQLSTVCTRLIVATHVEELDASGQSRAAPSAINPTLKRFTYSVRELGFGYSATFMDEDSVYGAQLFALTRTETGWSLDERPPVIFPELVKLAWQYGGLELNPWPM